MTTDTRATRALALADLTPDPRDKEAFRSAARAWDRVANSRVTFSHRPLVRDLQQLKLELADACGPFAQPSQRVHVERQPPVKGRSLPAECAECGALSPQHFLGCSQKRPELSHVLADIASIEF